MMCLSREQKNRPEYSNRKNHKINREQELVHSLFPGLAASLLTRTDDGATSRLVRMFFCFFFISKTNLN